jgi:cytochrome c oxidase subunit 2
LGRIATLIAISYGILGGALVLVLGVVVWRSTAWRRGEPDVRRLGEREKTWFGIVVVALVVLLFATIFFTPYGRTAETGALSAAGRSGAGGGLSFDVRAQQFAFVIPGKAIKAGVPVTFRLTSADVNHGFAVFNERNEFLFQAQVMPGRTQEYVYTFKKPGRYHVVCFEFCGVGHDQMTGEFQVTR